MRNKRFPKYPDDSDYSTNSPSYYDDLARKQKLMQLLTEKIWDYDDEIKEYFKRWKDNLETINEDVIEMMVQWSEDGTLDHIINDTIFNWKADKTYVDDEIERLEQKDENLINQMDQNAVNLYRFNLKSEDEDPNFNNTTIIETVFAMGGNYRKYILPPNKVFKVRSLTLPSNTILDLNGSTLKLIDGQAEYMNVITTGGNGLTKNVGIMNGVIDGNKDNQIHNYFQHGIYLLETDGVTISNIEIKNVLGDGLRLGYTDYFTKNVTINDLYVHHVERNDIAYTHCENIYARNVRVDSTAINSASVDLEIQDDTDIIRNIVFDNLSVKSDNLPVKLMKNTFKGILENIVINNLLLDGTGGLQTDDADNVKLVNVTAINGAKVEIVGTRDLTIDNFLSDGCVGNGLYIRRSTHNGHDSERIYLSNIEIRNSSSYGLILQQTKNVSLTNIRVSKSGVTGLGFLSGNQHLSISNVASFDNTGNGVEFTGLHPNLLINGLNAFDNGEENIKDIPTNAVGMVSKDRIQLSKGNINTSISVDETGKMTLPMVSIPHNQYRAGYAQGYDTIENNTLYRDKHEETLKFKNNSGRIQQVSFPRASTPPATSDTLYNIGDILLNNNPKAGVHVGWVCIAGGTTPTWKPFGMIE